jgi:hypothetical protein
MLNFVPVSRTEALDLMIERGKNAFLGKHPCRDLLESADCFSE